MGKMTKLLHRLTVILAVSGGCLAAPVSALVTTGSTETIGTASLSNVKTVSQIDDEVYVISHKKSEGTRYKSLYKLTDEAAGTFTRIQRARGSFKVYDIITKFSGDLYTTATRKKGLGIDVYRSTDDGDTWSNVATIGYTDPTMRSEIVKYFNFDGRLFVVVTQDTLADDDFQTLVVWSTTDGSTWDSQEISSDSTDYSFVDTVVVNDTQYLLVNARVSGDDDYVQLFSTNHYTFTQVGSDGLGMNPVVYSAGDMIAVDDHLLVSADVWTGSDFIYSVYTSTDGITWSVGIQHNVIYSIQLKVTQDRA